MSDSKGEVLGHLLDIKEDMGEIKTVQGQHTERLTTLEGHTQTILSAPLYQLDREISKKIVKMGGLWAVLFFIITKLT